MAAFLDDDRSANFYLCGPRSFMDLAEHSLKAAGVDDHHIFIERFLVEEAAEELEDRDGAAAPPAPSEVGAGRGRTPASVTILIDATSVTVPYRHGDTILETARRGALRPPSSCEAGDCATCMAMLRRGSVRMRRNNALTPEEVEEDWVLTCQAEPTSEDLTVEYEAM